MEQTDKLAFPESRKTAGKGGGVLAKIANRFRGWRELFRHADVKTTASMLIMGLGQFLRGQWLKGIAYLAVHAGFLAYYALAGAGHLVGFFTLGDIKANPWEGVKGHNSVDMLIMGIFALIVLLLFIAMYAANVKDAFRTQLKVEAGERPESNAQSLHRLIDADFYKTALLLPVLGVAVFNILPIVFMILVAFTNYGGEVVPPELISWTGFQSFVKILALKQFSPTFGKILVWNFAWAILATALNYFGGLGLALLYNKKCVKGKAFWRAFPILAYAIPGFITLLSFKFMFANGGPVNQIFFINKGREAYSFLGMDSTWSARTIGLLVNMWISVPTSMLLATSILSNMNTDQYEAARVDGANAWVQFRRITLPFVIFATTPVLITQFIGNFNNFGIFFFLRGSIISDGYYLASDTDLLINWLYRLSIENNYYSVGAAISLIIFIITSTVSLLAYVLSPSYKAENTYK